MLFRQCIKLKKMVVQYNRKKVLEEDIIRCDFHMYTDGEWSCILKTHGAVDLVDFMPILEWASTLYVSPFMWGTMNGFRLHIQ